MKKDLPIGINTFENIIKYNYVYVDKTKFIYEITRKLGKYFLSRPRRFGKSLLLDTIKCLFEGKKELFEGLYIYDKWDWNKKYPVIKIDFVGGNFIETENLKKRLYENLIEICEYHQLEIAADNDLSVWFRRIILSLHQKYQQKVVILVDEYDKPILDCITDTQTAIQNREILKGFYSVIKASDEVLQFAFLTGVSKFTKTSIFSGLNNLWDITLEKEFATICGYTHEDLLNDFSEYLEGIDLEEVKRWYNGYCWDIEEPKVYNPFDILKFLHNKKYRAYWFETGTPTFLIKLFQAKEYYVPDLEQTVADIQLLSTFDIDNLPIVSVLWQTGYLTIHQAITQYNITRYRLSYPNFEVEQSFNQVLLSLFVDSSISQEGSLVYDTIVALDAGDIDRFKSYLETLFSGVSYTYSEHIKSYEGFYGSMIYCFFKGLGLHCITEDITNRGKIDLTLLMRERIYLFEFKMAHHKQGALEQVKKKKYYEKYLNSGKELYLIGLIFDYESKNITAFEWEKVE